MLNWSGRAGELGGPPGPAPFPLPRGYPHVWQPSEMTGREGREAREGRVTREGRVIHCGGAVPA